MRKPLLILGILLGFSWVLAACQQQQNQTFPTLEASPAEADLTNEVTAQPTQISPTIPRERPTLPPTWTPAASDTPTLVPATATEVPPELPPTPLEVCNTFGEDLQRNNRTYVLGEPATVFWTQVEGAASYYIRLIDAEGEMIFEDYTLNPPYIFKADLFEKDKQYGWEVYPLDPLNQQMCTSRGAELFPTLPQ